MTYLDNGLIIRIAHLGLVSLGASLKNISVLSQEPNRLTGVFLHVLSRVSHNNRRKKNIGVIGAWPEGQQANSTRNFVAVSSAPGSCHERPTGTTFMP